MAPGKVKHKPLHPRPVKPPKAVKADPQPETGPSFSVNPYYTFNYRSIATGGGPGYGARFLTGEVSNKGGILWGLMLAGESSNSLSHVDELKGQSDTRTSGALLVENRRIDGPFISRELHGIGIGKFTPAVPSGMDKTDWWMLHVESTSSLVGIQIQPGGTGWYAAGSVDLSSFTYLNLVGKKEFGQYSSMTRDFGLSLSLDVGWSKPGKEPAKKDIQWKPTWQEVAHETIKYAMDDAKNIFSAREFGNPVQNTKGWQESIGITTTDDNKPSAVTATTDTSTLLILDSLSSAMGKNSHLKTYDSFLDKDTRFNFWLGNVINTGALGVGALASGSDAMSQGFFSSLQHTSHLTAMWRGDMPETTYWVRFATPFAMMLGGFAASGGLRQSLLSTAAEGMFGTALYPGSTLPLASRSISMSVGWRQSSKQTFKNGGIEGERGEIGIETRFPSGLSTRLGITSPVLSLGNGNVATFGENIGSGFGFIDSNGSPYEAATLPATISSMIGWRGIWGEHFYATAAGFAGAVVEMGPVSPKPGLGARASVGGGVGFGEKGWLKLGAEVFGAYTLSANSYTTDGGVAVMLTKQY